MKQIITLWAIALLISATLIFATARNESDARTTTVLVQFAAAWSLIALGLKDEKV